MCKWSCVSLRLSKQHFKLREPHQSLHLKRKLTRKGADCPYTFRPPETMEYNSTQHVCLHAGWLQYKASQVKTQTFLPMTIGTLRKRWREGMEKVGVSGWLSDNKLTTKTLIQESNPVWDVWVSEWNVMRKCVRACARVILPNRLFQFHFSLVIIVSKSCHQNVGKAAHWPSTLAFITTEWNRKTAELLLEWPGRERGLGGSRAFIWEVTLIKGVGVRFATVHSFLHYAYILHKKREQPSGYSNSLWRWRFGYFLGRYLCGAAYVTPPPRPYTPHLHYEE